MMHFRSATTIRLLGASAAALAIGLCISPAIAAGADQAPTDLPTAATGATAPEGGEIVVTGSRLAATGFSAPTPVSVIGAADIARKGSTNITEVLNQVPAFRAQNTPQTAANITANLGASTADLRGLGASRTLVLINGRRVVGASVRQASSTVPANVVDLNMIPTSLIERAEVVTGGASAQYGSDAVAGVVNIILNTKMEGFRGTVQYGQTDHDDAKDYAASIGWGAKLGDRGHIIVGVDFDKNKGTGDCYTRAWCAAARNQVTAPVANRGNGVAAVNILPNTTTATASYNGLITAANTAGLTTAQAAAANAAFAASGISGTEFATNGQSTFRHNYGLYYFNGGLFQSGGGDGIQPYYQNFALSVPLRKIASYGHAEYELTDGITAFADLSYADIRGTNPNTQNRDTNIVIRADNAFLPASTAAAIAALPASAPGVPASVLIGRIGQDFGPAVGHVQRNTFRGVGGFNGSFANDWKWDAYYQYGRTNYHQQTTNDKINTRYLNAIDAVRRADGVIVCRINSPTDFIAGTNTVNTANDDPNCSPLNIFGQNNWSQQAKNYAFGTAIQNTHITQQVLAATLSGSLFDLWAGPLSFAVGGEYRRESAGGSSDPISAALNFYTNGGAAISGRVNVKEGFVELGLPLIKDASFTHALDLNGAARVTDYSTSGSVTSWKVGATWEPVRQVRFRVTRSRDIRAPNIFELYGPQSTSFQSVVDSVTGANFLPSIISGGNPNLQPETAKTFTTGLVLQPDFWGLNRLRFSVDYYDIKLNNVIASLSAQQITTLCNAGQTSLCAQIVRAGGSPTGAITQVSSTDLNLNRLHTRGLDFELSYSTPLSDLVDSWAGSLSARVLATRVAKLATTDRTGTTIDRSNQVGAPVSNTSGVPRWQGNLFLTYSNGPFSGTAQVRYISSGLRDTTLIGPEDSRYASLLTAATCPLPLQGACTVNLNQVKAYAYLNINLSYAIVDEGARKVEVFGVVNNVFNTNPPNYLASSFGATNNALYDVLGRAYRVGVRVAF